MLVSESIYCYMILAFNAWDTILLSGLRLCVWVCLEVFKQVLSHS
jgi:hypothetical protein